MPAQFLQIDMSPETVMDIVRELNNLLKSSKVSICTQLHGLTKELQGTHPRLVSNEDRRICILSFFALLPRKHGEELVRLINLTASNYINSEYGESTEEWGHNNQQGNA